MKGKFRFAVPELSLKMTDEQTLQVKNLEINVEYEVSPEVGLQYIKVLNQALTGLLGVFNNEDAA
jgi:hypothetical protein